jgi:1,4-dihydroxy-2-naphthoate octaprenyltransferase
MRAWLGILMVTGLVAWGHCMNSVLDYEADLDKGEIGERSDSKSYSGGQSVIASGQASREAIIYISMLWALFSLGIAVWFASHGTWIMIPLWGIGIAVPFVYTEGKFSWYHELALGVGVGPLAAMVGAYAVNPSPPIIHCLLASIPFAIVLAFAGLSLDEWPDAKQNLIKGVKSLAFKIYEWSDWTADIKLGTYVKSLSLLQFYVSAWLLFMMVFQVFLITIGVLSPMTGIAFLAIHVEVEFQQSHAVAGIRYGSVFNPIGSRAGGEMKHFCPHCGHTIAEGRYEFKVSHYKYCPILLHFKERAVK